MKHTMKIDYYDQVWQANSRKEGLYDENRIDLLLERCAKSEFSHVLWRTSVGGKVAYPSRVMTVFDKEYRLSGNALGECLAQFDPLAYACKSARSHGLKIFAWVTLTDSYAPGMEDRFFAQHPEYLLVDRENNIVERGVPCYAYPEVCEYRLAEVRELMGNYDLDGIYYSSHSHNDCTKSSFDHDGSDAYGFNQPVALEYLKRYGTDPRIADFDLQKIRSLRGEYYLKFLKDAHDIIKKQLRELMLDVRLPIDKKLGAGIYAGPRGEYYVPVNELLPITEHITFCPEQMSNNAESAQCAVNEMLRQCSENKTYRVLGHVGFSREDAGKNLGTLRSFVKDFLPSNGIAGLVFHEAMTFEFFMPELWDFAGECARL